MSVRDLIECSTPSWRDGWTRPDAVVRDLDPQDGMLAQRPEVASFVPSGRNRAGFGNMAIKRLLPPEWTTIAQIAERGRVSTQHVSRELTLLHQDRYVERRKNGAAVEWRPSARLLLERMRHD